MLRNNLYYGIKPFLPLSLRLSLRRWVVRRQRAGVDGTWPILPGSEKPPAGWPGWPDSKKFAVVLTHDVEGQTGLDKCQAVMELELKYGFHSSFNLIPRGEYQASAEIRNEISSQGFEVGVHDLYHDGKLYRKKSEFDRHAVEINKYVREWGAAGFRSGFMLHNLNWIHELDVQYDASTFDTDPFEPQPEGKHTIFPFWVPRPLSQESGVRSQVSGLPDSRPLSPGSRPLTADPCLLTPGYVELPYTLPQDSTLFLLLQERHPDIWFQKLDWIAKHGGMVLLNVHPDYMRFPGEPVGVHTYPAEFYVRFLEYIHQRYEGAYWQPLARDVAAFVRRSKPQRPLPPRRICMVTHSDYTRDARVTRYAEALAQRGDHVSVLALQGTPGLPAEEAVGNVHLVRLQRRYAKDESSRLSYLFPVLRFLVASGAWLASRSSKERFDLIHIHNIPDFLVFAGLYPKLRGARVILDIHDVVPEFYASKFAKGERSFGIRLLKWMEIVSSKVADHIIIANDLWLDKYRKRTGANGKCSVFINNVDATLFRPRPRARNDGKLIMMFPGGLQWHQGLDIAIRAFEKIHIEFPNLEFHIYGDGNMKAQLVALAQELGLAGRVRFFNPLPVREVADVMANSDLGVVPKRADSFGNEAYSTKIMEFMSLGVPVVVSSTKIDRFYFNDSVVRFFESGNAEAMALAIRELLNDQSARERLAATGAQYAAANSWDSRKSDYLRLVDTLIDTEQHHLPSAP